MPEAPHPRVSEQEISAIETPVQNRMDASQKQAVLVFEMMAAKPLQPALQLAYSPLARPVKPLRTSFP